MTTRNPYIKLIRVGNIYAIEDPDQLGADIARNLVHFARKHGMQPAKVYVHPDTLNGYEGELVIESHDGKQVYRATIEAANTVGEKTYMITNGGDA
jgi:hypothetical protein